MAMAFALGRLNHVAIAVPDIRAASETYRKLLGATVSAIEDQPAHGVQTVFIELPNTKIELLGVLGDASPIRAFLEKSPAGGIHHVCYEVADIEAARMTRKGQYAKNPLFAVRQFRPTARLGNARHVRRNP